MPYLEIYSAKFIAKLTRLRNGEVKLGERVTNINNVSIDALTDELKKQNSKFVLLGLPEDIGVRANFGRTGADTAWHPAITNILNIQSNHFLNGEEILVLGHVDFSDLIEQASKLNSKKDNELKELRNLVSEIDNFVTPIIQSIVSAGKIPIVIGGGHNNAYGNLKGTSLALGKAINCINVDAHSDFRVAEGRHSGNGFSYAFNENHLNKYAVVGLHENYIVESVLQTMLKENKRINVSIYEDIFVREKISFSQAIDKAIEFAGGEACGLEIDLDSIQNIPASARTSSGISANKARLAVDRIAENSHIQYFHIAEGAPVLSHIKADYKTGKLIAYLVTDFIKASKSYHHNKFIES